MEIPDDLVRDLKLHMPKLDSHMGIEYCKTEISDEVPCGYNLKFKFSHPHQANDCFTSVNKLRAWLDKLTIPDYQI